MASLVFGGMSKSHWCFDTLLVAVFGTHRSQAGCARLPMPAWSGATVSFRLHPARHRVAAVSGRRHPRNYWSAVQGFPLWAIVRFRWLEAASGTACRLTSPQLPRSLFVGSAYKLTFFPIIFILTVLGF